MLRKVFFSLLLVSFVVGLVFLYMHFRKEKVPPGNVWDGVPLSAGVAIFSADATTALQQLGSNKIWQNVLNGQFFASLKKDMAEVEGNILKDPEASVQLKRSALVISSHQAGRRISFLFTIPAPNEAPADKVAKEIAELAGKGKPLERKYDNAIIYSIPLDSGDLTFSINEGLISLSTDPLLTEEAVRHIKQGTSLRNSKDFSDVYKTAGSKVTATVFVNYRNIGASLDNFFRVSNLKTVEMYGSWSALDVDISGEDALLSGFTLASDSTTSYLSIFKGQDPQETAIAHMLPRNTAYYQFEGFSEFKKYHREYQLFRKYSDPSDNSDAALSEVSTNVNYDVFFNFSSWIGKRICYFIPAGSQSTEMSLLVETSDITTAITSVDSLNSLLSKSKKDTSSFQGVKITRTSIDSTVFNSIFGSSASSLSRPFYSTIGKFMIFSNKKEILEQVINDHLSERSLATEPVYKIFGEKIPSEANLLIYLSPSRAGSLAEEFLEDHELEKLRNNNQAHFKVSAVAFHSSFSKGNMFYQNIITSYSDAPVNENLPAAEIALDSTIASGPFVFRNDILAQDVAGALYLFDMNGSLIWKKPGFEKITGKVQEVDAFNNGKKQFVFAASGSLYAVDRKGEFLPGFPASLASAVAKDIAVFDYDNNKSYRILVPCKDNNVYNYNIKGEPLKDWNLISLSAPPASSVKHVAVAGKDYLIIIDSKGKIYCTDRKGLPRLTLTEKLEVVGDIFIEKGNDLKNTLIIAADGNGNLQKVNLLNEKQQVKLTNAETYTFTHAEADVLTSQNEVHAFSKNGDRIFSQKFDEMIPEAPEIISNQGKNLLSVMQPASRKVIIFDLATGEQVSELQGTSQPVIADFRKDNKKDLILRGTGRTIFIYEFQK